MSRRRGKSRPSEKPLTHSQNTTARIDQILSLSPELFASHAKAEDTDRHFPQNLKTSNSPVVSDIVLYSSSSCHEELRNIFSSYEISTHTASNLQTVNNFLPQRSHCVEQRLSRQDAWQRFIGVLGYTCDHYF